MAKKARASQVKGIDIEGLNNILQLAVQVGRELDQIKIPYCFIGGKFQDQVFGKFQATAVFELVQRRI